MTDLHLATCSYRSLTDGMGVGVATSVGKPRTWGERPTLNPAAPYGVFNRQPALSEPEFRRLYLERLERKVTDIDVGLEVLAADHPGETLVLLCWCTVVHRDDFCHRLILSHWLEGRHGIEIPELTLERPS